MSEQVDTRGLSCPQPVVVTLNRMNQTGTGTIEVLVDSATARDNIVRMASSRGWQTEVNEKEDEFLLILTKV
jgi:TusA-related sulfurtransferase